MGAPLEVLQECMKNTSCIRNVCILAHVDHGKTTIADSLLATNRLVSKRMAGLVRYLDDRLDEQERGITMKSSAVSLINLVEDEDTKEEKPLLLNLIDTPGHIDFSSEVGAALRVCDGALVVVDLVEGVCVQTREAIKQAFTERCKMILILNKIDKLIVELHKEVNDIFQSILHAIEDCNAIVAELYQYEYCNPDVDIEDTGLLFSPDAGNVIFASAIDGWGFTLKQIASMFVNAIKSETVDSLNTKLWNFDAYVDGKTNTVKLGAIEKGKTNLFVQLCIKTIFHIYSTIVIQMQRDKVGTIVQKLNITNVTREMNHTDPKTQVKAIMQAWSPLADVILHQCMKIIPPPSNMHEDKIKYLLDFNKFCENEFHKNCLEKLITVFKSCSSDDSTPCTAYVSKMFCVDNKNLSQNKPKVFIPKPRPKNTEPKQENGEKTNHTEKEKNCEEEKPRDEFSIIALARVFTGCLKTGQEIYVLSPQYVPQEGKTSDTCAQLVKVKELYMLFGRELVLVDEITAGNVCGIGGLESAIVRTATLSTTLQCVAFIEHPSQPPIVRNAIEPTNPKDLPILRQGLRVLMQSDSCVQVVIEESGEYVLLTAGDVHLAKCLEDLTTKFAKIEINVSSPMVSLRETVTHGSNKSDLKKDLENSVTVEVAQIRLTVVVVALPDVIANEIEKNYKLLHSIEEHQQISGFELFAKRASKPEDLKPPTLKMFKSDVTNVSLKHVSEQLSSVFASCKGIWAKIENKVWSVGRMPDSINLLINGTSNYARNIYETLDEKDPRSCFDQFVVNAFNSCCKAGPLCEEPLKNCVFLVKNFEVSHDESLDGTTKTSVNIESALSSAFREAFEKQQQRLMEPMFTTSIQVNTNILGKVYSVVSKRHGKVLDAVGMDEQEKSFLVKAQIPVVESTGFANEMRKTTSGQAIPTLKFSHFEIIDGDPFYEPVEDDEEEEDVNVESAIRATKLRKAIRKRKGLHVEEQVVVHGEKQRTLNKKK
ncbi:elongation factor-like GTPase 1 [Tribolium castaneum]|uniref:Elongation factor 2-like Protein n=1 Tax=Tribolium castaneum TaxID=7070 RepID=D6WHT4_TRICA|nr:PREDICTED: elongation factor Tu GTP-binding domain-containing protein 1 [Tribolium castaneum]EFA00062.1 Elongation factor 2-like Protein [Tribolium castaneum]|eukprot:XP_008191066.1 PREDICTED: elongation factor Tu GTP-binding domain-containing protein 1 [Tribolium castaneum]